MLFHKVTNTTNVAQRFSSVPQRANLSIESKSIFVPDCKQVYLMAEAQRFNM